MCEATYKLASVVVFLAFSWPSVQVSAEIERNYDLVFERVEVDYKICNPWIKVHLGQATKWNRTASVVNSSYTLLNDLPLDTVFKMTAFEQMPNKRYSLIPMPFIDMNWCDFIKTDQYFYPSARKYSNYPKQCPFLKGVYTLQDYIIDMSFLPPEFPERRWRLDISMHSQGKPITKISVFVYVDRDL